jgi:biopolymer transport protein ExbD/biopolymer transport protein TolR
MSMDVGSKKVKSDINVTPLVDVVLVLLIIFMVITPLLQRGKAVVLPEARHLSELKKGGDPILVSITPDGKVWLDKEEVPRAELSQTLTMHMEMQPGAPIMLKVDRQVEYKHVREVVLEISKTHLLGISLAATQIKER